MADDVRTLILRFQAETEVARGQLNQLVGTLGTTASDVDQRLGQIESGFDRLNQNISGKMQVMGTAIGTALGSLVAQLPGQLVALTQRAIETAGSIKNTADALGISTDALQDFRIGTAKAGATTAAADAALAKFQETTGKAASGNKAALASFTALGVSIKDSNGNLRPFDELLRAVADGLERQPDPARQAAAAIKLFGSNGDAILPFLRDGADGIDAMATAAETLGLKLTPETIKALDDLGNKAADVQKIFSAQLAAAIGQNADAIIALGDAALGAAPYLQSVLNYVTGLSKVRANEGFLAQFTSDFSRTAALGAKGGEVKVYGDELMQARARRQQLENSSDISAPGKLFFARSEETAARARYDAAVARAEAARKAGAGAGAAPGSAAGGVVVDPAAPAAKAGRTASRGPKPYDLQGAINKVLASPLTTSGELDKVGESADRVLNPVRTLADTLRDAFDPGPISDLRQHIPGLTDDIDAADRSAQDLGMTLASNLLDAAVNAGNLGDTLVNTFARAGLAMVQSGILNFLSGGKEGTSFASAFSSIGKLFGGKRASGGPITAGMAYLVGEKGPELVVPPADGFVVPNHRLGGGGGGGMIVQQSFDLSGTILTEELFAHINAKASAAAQAGALAGRALARQDNIRAGRRRLG